MRLFLLLFVLMFFPCSFVFAQTMDEELYASPWDDEAEQETDLDVKRLSLADIESLFNAPEKKNVRKPQKTQRKAHNEEKPQSKIEASYSSRIIENLEQYGYDLFDSAVSEDENSSLPKGQVQDGYILSVGDQLNIVQRGQQNNQKTYAVNSRGQIILDNLNPVSAAGRKFVDVKDELETAIASLHNTQIFVSLAAIRQIGVLVVGHVEKPGRKNLSSFNSAFDALSKSGGIQKAGSLRQVKLVRKGKSYPIDLYELTMASKNGADRLLQDGDRIIVPPIGSTIAISGGVKRPAIYEIRKSEVLSAHQALLLAGGTLTPGKSRYIKMEYLENGEEVVTDISDLSDKSIKHGTIFNIAVAQNKKAEAITLSGHTSQPGAHDIKKSRTLSSLITDDKMLGEDIYPLIAVIERRDAEQLTKKYIEFSPYQVVRGQFDKSLQEGDDVRLFSMTEIHALENKKLLHKISTQSKKSLNPVLVSFLKERSAFVRGAVRKTGAYPVVAGTNLKNVLSVAGGVALEGNKESVEVTSREQDRRLVDLAVEQSSSVDIHAGDTIRVNQKFHKITEKTVSITGEVNHPGNYDLKNGDTLHDLILRAGGMTEQSYPLGTIFSRASERKREQSRYKAQAQNLEMQLASALQNSDKNNKPDAGQVTLSQTLIEQLKQAKAVGRITVESDPIVLAGNQDKNILLEKGDRVYIPKRPMTVRVTGEVLSPAALQFETGKEALDYIREAGGTTHYADKSRTFVVYPNGAAQPLKVSTWSHQAVKIPPGSTIIVPRDPKPFDFLDSAGRVSQVIANLAISGLYIEAIGDDN